MIGHKNKYGKKEFKKTKRFNGLIFLPLIFAVFVSLVLAEEFAIYENTEIFFRYPSDWNIYEDTSSEDSIITLRSPDWTEKEGGATITYSRIGGINKIDKNEFTKEYLSALKETYDSVVLDSSEHIFVDNFDALKIEVAATSQSVSLKQTYILIEDDTLYHALIYTAKSEEYATYLPIFNDLVDSFNIKNPHKASLLELLFLNQIYLIGGFFSILCLLIIFGVYKTVKTKEINIKPKDTKCESYKKTIEEGWIAWFVLIMIDFLSGFKLYFKYISFIILLVVLVYTIKLIDTKERKFAINNLYGIIFLMAIILISFLLTYLFY